MLLTIFTNLLIYFVERQIIWSSLPSHFHWCPQFFSNCSGKLLEIIVKLVSILFLCFGICPQRLLLPSLDFLFDSFQQFSFISDRSITPQKGFVWMTQKLDFKAKVNFYNCVFFRIPILPLIRNWSVLMSLKWFRNFAFSLLPCCFKLSFSFEYCHMIFHHLCCSM